MSLQTHINATTALDTPQPGRQVAQGQSTQKKPAVIYTAEPVLTRLAPMLPMPLMAGSCAAVTHAELPHLGFEALQTVLQLLLHARCMVVSAMGFDSAVRLQAC